MKRRRSLPLLFLLVVLLALSGCREATEDSQDVPSTSPSVHTERMTDPIPPEFVLPNDFQIRRGLDEIEVFPFSTQALADAAAIAERTILELFSGEEISEFTLTTLAFDPELTDANIRQQLVSDGNLKEEENYYACRITFAAIYYVTYNYDKSTKANETNGVMQVSLSRESTDSPWSYIEGSQSFSCGEYSARAMNAMQLDTYSGNGISGRLIAGYACPGGSYNLYTVGADKKVHYNENVWPDVFPDIEDLHPEGTALAADDLSALQAFFNPNDIYAKTTESDWYAQCLTSEYTSPEKIDLKMLFYSGILDGSPEIRQLSDEERNYLTSVWGEDPMSFTIDRLPVAQMDRVLQKYFGITLAQTEKIGLEDFTYWEKTDCYYRSHSDTNFFRPQVFAAYAQQDGSIRVYYLCKLFHVTAIATIKPAGDGYQILSNEYLN